MATKQKRIKVTVTAEDICRANADRDIDIFIATRCPVALALQRATKDANARAGATFLMWDGGTMKQPPKVQRFITCFDGRKPVKPFSFYLEVSR